MSVGSSTEASKGKGIMDSVTGGMEAGANKLFEYIEKAEEFHPVAGKAAKIGFCLLVMGAGFLIFYFSNHTTIAVPGPLAIMGMPMMLGISGLGVKWLIENIFGEVNRTAAKIAAFICLLGFLGGPIFIVGAGMIHGFTQLSISSYVIGGLIMLGCTAYPISNMKKVWSQPDYEMSDIGPPPGLVRRAVLSKTSKKRSARKSLSSKKVSVPAIPTKKGKAKT